jgi:hypothetical protein
MPDLRGCPEAVTLDQPSLVVAPPDSERIWGTFLTHESACINKYAHPVSTTRALAGENWCKLLQPLSKLNLC